VAGAKSPHTCGTPPRQSGSPGGKMTSRRRFLAGMTVPALTPFAALGAKLWQPSELAEGAAESAVLESLPGKVPLIKRSYRPPNFETPIDYFREPITPNNAFFVRYHLSGIPEVDAKTWRLKVGGDAAGKPFELDFAALRKDFEHVEVVAVNQCSGNRRGLFQPHVQGVEWGVGAMGNARWKGVRLRDVLQRAGIAGNAVEVAFNGADTPAMQQTPDFVKSLPVERALDENTLIAFEMNGQALPHFNGFPARLVVPGWTGTYWVKHLTDVDVRATPLQQFWMNPAYRIPRAPFPKVDRFPSQETAENQPITDIVVNSLITSLRDGQRVHKGQVVEIAGVAWDGGRGVRDVEVSMDGGSSWYLAFLGKDYGRFSFRTFSHKFKPSSSGAIVVMARAYNMRGDTQEQKLILNPAGYHHNVVQRVRLEVV
jgi:DMSO/TMAO reductase YedYZ molybdopterin-dependent catalytic subunit